MENDFEAFFKANERQIHYQIHRLGITEEAYGEFYTEGMLALWKAYKGYKPEKGDIGTFLNYQIRYRLMDLLRKKKRDVEVTEEIVDGVKVQLDDGNCHRASGVPLVKVTGHVLADTAFWEEAGC